MAANTAAADYYAVLQVHPDADSEVIDAAYRQLMKKYHPDRAGLDPRLSALHHRRAKAINEAYGVLRDPARRRLYDHSRVVVGSRPPPSTPHPSVPNSTAARDAQAPAPDAPPANWGPPIVEPESSHEHAGWRGPVVALAAAYYLLPGPYEWEPGSRRELRTAILLPPLGIAGFALASGRLAPWIGHSLNATLLAWGVLVLVSLPIWPAMPRVAMATVPSVLLLNGAADGFLREVHAPRWLAFVMLGSLSLIFSARLYLFSVLPTLAICWGLTQLT
jgi:hypothetical protein